MFCLIFLESRTNVEEDNFNKPDTDCEYACLIGISPTVSKPFCDPVSSHSPIIKEINYLDKVAMNKCTVPKNPESKSPSGTLDSVDQLVLSSSLPVYNKDEGHIQLDTHSLFETHNEEPVSQLAPVDRSVEELRISSTDLEARSDVQCNILPVGETSVHPAETLHCSTESDQVGLDRKRDLVSCEVFQHLDPTDLNGGSYFAFRVYFHLFCFQKANINIFTFNLFKIHAFFDFLNLPSIAINKVLKKNESLEEVHPIL